MRQVNGSGEVAKRTVLTRSLSPVSPPSCLFPSHKQTNKQTNTHTYSPNHTHTHARAHTNSPNHASGRRVRNMKDVPERHSDFTWRRKDFFFLSLDLSAVTLLPLVLHVYSMLRALHCCSRTAKVYECTCQCSTWHDQVFTFNLWQWLAFCMHVKLKLGQLRRQNVADNFSSLHFNLYLRKWNPPSILFPLRLACHEFICNSLYLL